MTLRDWDNLIVNNPVHPAAHLRYKWTIKNKSFATFATVCGIYPYRANEVRMIVANDFGVQSAFTEEVNVITIPQRFLALKLRNGIAEYF